MERSQPEDPSGEWGDEEIEPEHLPLPPPEMRAWRHPSEVAGQHDAPTLSPYGPRRGSGARMPVALLAGTAGALALASLLAALLPISGWHRVATRAEADVALGLPTSVRVLGTLAVTTTTPPSTPTGVVELTVVTRSGEHSAYATVVDGSLVTTSAAIDGATDISVVSAGERVLATVVDAAHEGVAVLRTTRTVSSPAAIGSSADLDDGDTVMVMIDDALRTTSVDTVGETVRSAAGETLEFLLRAKGATEAKEGAPLLDPNGLVVGLCTHDADGAIVGIPIELAASRAKGVRDGSSTGVTWLGLAARNDGGGVLVTEVTAGGPAQIGDLAPGDRIVAVNGRPTPTVTKLVLRLRAHRPHDAVVITIVRDGETLQRRVELGSDRD